MFPRECLLYAFNRMAAPEHEGDANAGIGRKMAAI